MSKSTTTWVVNLKDSNFNDPKYNKIFCHLNIFNVSFQKKFMKKGNITISINIKTFYFEPVNITYPHTHTHTHTYTHIYPIRTSTRDINIPTSSNANRN